MPAINDQLRSINNFDDLIHYLEEQLDWPLQEYGFDELTFEYQPAELGLKDEDAAKVRAIHQLRPLQSGQPWGIFFVEFEKKKLPVVVLRRILSHLVIKKRASANKAKEAAWHAEDLMFITTFGEESSAQREIAFAHFHQSPGDMPTLRVLGWDGSDTPLKLAHVDHELHQYLIWPGVPADLHAWRDEWRKPFRHRIGHVISTADLLAEELAKLARGIRDKAVKMIAVESAEGPLRKLHKAFQTALIHDLTENDFADTYAQTITYGLLTAAISRTEKSDGRHGTFIIAENVTDMVPMTNPFLREMLQTFLKIGGRKGGIDFDELGIQDVVELLRGEETDLPAILRDFGNKTQGEDPVIHFYEHFLSAYNKRLKIQRGVFYTPQPVVSYIIRSVHELLQTEFGLEDGLASTITWGEMLKRHPEMKLPIRTPKNPAKPDSEDIVISPDTPFVMILDIATGTGTFLVEIIDVIHKTMKAKWQKLGKRDQDIVTLWNDYVPKHLLPRLYGYELMMAPYAIAHMKIGLKLFETGYNFKSDERVRVYLTNTLEPPSDAQQQLAGILPALAHEADAVNAVKRNVRFTVVVGNPPYAVNSANKNSPIDPMLGLYKQGLDGERNLKPINDDYVKFLRFSQIILSESMIGVVGMITNHSYTTERLFRQMRRSLIDYYKIIAFLDLRGDVNRDPNMRNDRNVFEIQQGVGINLFCKGMSKSASAVVSTHEIVGPLESKYAWLASHALKSTPWIPITPQPDLYCFRNFSEIIRKEYNTLIPINELFQIGNVGYQTHRDGFVIDTEQADLIKRIDSFKRTKNDETLLSVKFDLKSNRDWSIIDAHNQICKEKDIQPLIWQTLYRPFDLRYICYASCLIDYDRRELMRHMLASNIGLLISKVFDEHEFTSVLITKYIVESKVADRTRGAYLFPLRITANGNQTDLDLDYQSGWMTNLSEKGTSLLTKTLNVKLIISDNKGANGIITDHEVINYIYAVLYSPEYRVRYSEFLKSDYPHLPITGNLELFRSLANLGGELVAIHLLESPKVNNFITHFAGKGDNSIPKKPTWRENAVWINATQRFDGVPENVWNFHIGGYQVCEKWLKDRKGRTLSDEDIAHYQRIVVALSETIRIMAEIEEVIDQQGGWPIK